MGLFKGVASDRKSGVFGLRWQPEANTALAYMAEASQLEVDCGRE